MIHTQHCNLPKNIYKWVNISNINDTRLLYELENINGIAVFGNATLKDMECLNAWLYDIPYWITKINFKISSFRSLIQYNNIPETVNKISTDIISIVPDKLQTLKLDYSIDNVYTDFKDLKKLYITLNGDTYDTKINNLPNSLLKLKIINGNMKNIVIPESVEYIVFAGQGSNYAKITYPKSLKKIKINSIDGYPVECLHNVPNNIDVEINRLTISCDICIAYCVRTLKINKLFGDKQLLKLPYDCVMIN